MLKYNIMYFKAFHSVYYVYLHYIFYYCSMFLSFLWIRQAHMCEWIIILFYIVNCYWLSKPLVFSFFLSLFIYIP
jgi:hypothetical protein